MKRALISVSDKTGLETFAKGLIELDFEIISTGNTKKFLEEKGIESISVEEVTNFPEILDGRVKTLHPNLLGAILCDYGKDSHIETIEMYGIKKIDLVVCNLYPFEENYKKNLEHDLLIEKIDIGGPTLIRAAAKNYKNIGVSTNPDQYEEIINTLKENNDFTLELKEKLAREAFNFVAHYDTVINSYFDRDSSLPMNFKKSFQNKKELRYGLNPFQKSNMYFDELPITQIQGKELSYNNFLDMDAIINMLSDFNEDVCIAVKHLNPCGIAFGKTPFESYVNAYNCDSISIFGGIVGFNREVDGDTAREMTKIFLEVIVAPSYTEEALDVFATKKNLRVVTFVQPSDKIEYRSILGGVLLQEKDKDTLKIDEIKCVTNRVLTDKDYEELVFADTVCKHVTSNAIVVTKDMKTVGIGVGQTNRVGAAMIALEQAKEKGIVEGLTLASDAFFPFDDVVTLAKDYGVDKVIQPGGSIRDEDVINKCNELDIAMGFSGKRHFKH